MRVLLCQRRLSFKSWNYLKDVIVSSLYARKSRTKKTFEANPFGEIRQHFQGVYFLSH